MTTTRQPMPEAGNLSQYLPTGFDPGNGSAKLRVDGAEIRIPSLIQPIHGNVYDIPQTNFGCMITYLSGSRKDLEKSSWLVGERDIIGSLQVEQLERSKLPQAKQYKERTSVHIGSGGAPGVQQRGQNFKAWLVETGTPLHTADKYSTGIDKA